MGKMLLEKIISSKLIPEGNIYVANRAFEKIETLKENYTVNICRTNAEAAENADLIIRVAFSKHKVCPFQFKLNGTLV